MDARGVAAALALGRIALGGGLALAPRLGALWVGPEAELTATKVVARGLGARDVGLALGTLAALRRGGRPGPWLLAGALADATDFGATLAGGRDLPPAGRAGVAAVAGAATATGLALARSLK